MFLLTKRKGEHLVPGTKYPSRFDILLLVFIFPLTGKHPVHFFKEVIFFSVKAILNKSFHLPKAGGAINLKLSRPVLFQQSDLYAREDEIQFDMFVIDKCNVVEEGLNYISPLITPSLQILTLCVLLVCAC